MSNFWNNLYTIYQCFQKKIHENFTETVQKGIYKETIMVYNMPMFRKGGIEMIESFVNIESASQLAGNVPFQNFVQGDERVTSWSEIQDGHDCAITVRCKNMSALEELTKELKNKCDILNVSHNVIVSQ